MTSKINADGDLRSFERNRYFHAKLMTARDMQAEQDYFVDRAKATNRYVTGYGITCGLDVLDLQQVEDELKVELTPGFAVDSFGNPIVVQDGGSVTVTDPVTNEPPTTLPTGNIFLYLRYDECSIETVPLPGSENACKNECTYNRVLEVFDIVFEEVESDQDVPVGFKPVPDIEFPNPEDVTDDGGVIEPDDPGLVKMARSYYADYLEECASATDPWVFLGTFTGSNVDGKWTRIDPSLPDGSYVYSNDFLHAGLARHTAGFRNPHRTTLAATPIGGNVPDGASAFLTAGETFAQGQILFFDGHDLVESETGNNFGDTTTDERTFAVRDVTETNDQGSLAAEFVLDDEGHVRLDTQNFDGDYVVTYGETIVRADDSGVGTPATGADAVETSKFTVTTDAPLTGTAEETGAKVRIQHDDPAGAVNLTSSDATVSIDTTVQGEATPSEINLTVSHEAIADNIDAIRTVNEVGGNDQRNVQLHSEETLTITPRHALNRVDIELSESIRDQLSRVKQYVLESSLWCVCRFQKINRQFGLASAGDIAKMLQRALEADVYRNDEAYRSHLTDNSSLFDSFQTELEQLGGVTGKRQLVASVTALTETLAAMDSTPIDIAAALSRVCKNVECIEWRRDELDYVDFHGFIPDELIDIDERRRFEHGGLTFTHESGNMLRFVSQGSPQGLVKLGLHEDGLRIDVPPTSVLEVEVSHAVGTVSLSALDSEENELDVDETPENIDTESPYTLRVQTNKIDHVVLSGEFDEAFVHEVCFGYVSAVGDDRPMRTFINTNAVDADGNDLLEVEAAPDQPITGRSHFDPETELNVRVKAIGTNPFFQTDTVSVDENHDYAASFDFSDVTPGTKFVVTVRHRGSTKSVLDNARVV
ncbi:BGTF surface domain-containing protein [Haladaptatus sp. DFWS20]|uniref:BGTF surface domain-containing protein n=1 Tax=Haladaptatus sp. DFWS20 TaxID=3403467 RepID=UPI003EB95900